MTRIIAVANAKGGTGKTTTAVNLAHGLALQGQRVLLVDLDSQGSASLALGLERAAALHRLLVADDPLPGLVVAARKHLDMLRSNDTTADVRDWLGVKAARDARAALNALGRALGDHVAAYDFVVIDCAPALDILTLNALMAAREVLVPVSVDFLSAAGTRQHIETLDGLRDMGGKAELRFVVPTFYDGRLIRAREILETLQRAFGPS